MQRQALGIWTKLFYGFGSVAFGVKDNGFAFFLLLYYNQVLGLPERWVGFGIMFALLADAISDPIVGYLSDHLHSPWGRRHPFMYAAALPAGVSYYFLWNPPAGLSATQLFAYFIVLSVLVRVLIGCYEIPSASLVAELTDHYDERTSILSYRFFFGWWGGLTMAVLAYTVFLTPDATHAVGVLNPNGYQTYGLAASLIMSAAILISAAGTHSYIPHLRRPSPRHGRGLPGAVAEIAQTLANRSFLGLFCAGIFGGMAAGITAALTLYFNTYFWELSSLQMSVLTLLNFVSAAVAFALGPGLSRRLGKKRAAITAALVVVVFGPMPITLRLFGLFPANGSPLLLPTLALFNTTLVALFIMASIYIASMLADVVEDNEVGTGRRSEGVFFAVNAFVQKSVSGIGIFSSTLLLGLIGFPRGAQPGAVDEIVVRNLGLVYVPTLVLLYVITLGCLSIYRISRATHEANLERLARGQSATISAAGPAHEKGW
jgi:GPH family glycoside/pentoside/hexuronide:cation symporter